MQIICLLELLHHGYPLLFSGIFSNVLVLLVQEARGLHDCRRSNSCETDKVKQKKPHLAPCCKLEMLILECTFGLFLFHGSLGLDLLFLLECWPIKIPMQILVSEHVGYGMEGLEVMIPVIRSLELLLNIFHHSAFSGKKFSDCHIEYFCLFCLANFAGSFPIYCLIHANMWSQGAEIGIPTQSTGSYWIRTGMLNLMQFETVKGRGVQGRVWRSK